MKQASTISKAPFALILLVLALAALAACTSEKVVEVPVEKVVEVPKDAGSLVIYSGRSESLVGPIIEQFKEATGIDVSVKYGSTSEMAATLLEEGKNSPADVFFAQDPGGLGAVSNEGMLSDLPDEIVSLVPGWARSPTTSGWDSRAGPGPSYIIRAGYPRPTFRTRCSDSPTPSGRAG